MIVNFITIRHALTCANLVYHGFLENMYNKMARYVEDTDINYNGIEQCLQLSDFLKKRQEDGYDYIFGKTMNVIPINDKTGEKPGVIFCCSELRRTQESLYLSMIRYMPEYLKNGGKIMILPWLNAIGGIKLIDNNGKARMYQYYAETYENRKKNWRRFIRNVSNYLKDNSLRYKNDFDLLLEEDWDKIFYFNPLIYKTFTKNKIEPFTNEGKILYNKRLKKAEEMKDIMKDLNKIILKYIDDNKIDNKENINLVFCSHRTNVKAFMKYFYPSSVISFKKQMPVNCELIKLPKYDLEKNRFVRKHNNNFGDFRIFPVGFHNNILKISVDVPYRERNGKIFNYFIFFAPKFNLFYTFLNLVQTSSFLLEKNKFRRYYSNYLHDDKDKFNKKLRVEIIGPLKKFFNMNYIEYLDLIKKDGDYYKILEKLAKFYGDKDDYFYNYNTLLKIMLNNSVKKENITIGEMIGEENFFKYFFGICNKNLIKKCPSYLYEK